MTSVTLGSRPAAAGSGAQSSSGGCASSSRPPSRTTSSRPSSPSPPVASPRPPRSSASASTRSSRSCPPRPSPGSSPARRAAPRGRAHRHAAHRRVLRRPRPVRHRGRGPHPARRGRARSLHGRHRLLAAISLAIMPFLSWIERRTGRELGPPEAVADSKQTLLCTYLSAVLLVGLVLNPPPSGGPGPAPRRSRHRGHRRQGGRQRLARRRLLPRTLFGERHARRPRRANAAATSSEAPAGPGRAEHVDAAKAPRLNPHSLHCRRFHNAR